MHAQVLLQHLPRWEQALAGRYLRSPRGRLSSMVLTFRSANIKMTIVYLAPPIGLFLVIAAQETSPG